MLTPEDIVRKLYVENITEQSDKQLDPVDLINTDQLTKRLFTLIVFVYERLSAGSYKNKNLLWPYNSLCDTIAKFGIKYVPLAPHDKFLVKLNSELIKSLGNLLSQVATLPREKQHKLYDSLLSKIKANLEITGPPRHHYSVDTLADGTFFRIYDSLYNGAKEVAEKILEIEKGNQQAGANLDF